MLKKVLEIPRGPLGIEIIFLNPRRMLNCHSSIPRGVEFSEELPSLVKMNIQKQLYHRHL